MAETANDLRRLFGPFDTRINGYTKVAPPGYTPASVLVPLFYRDGIWHVLLTVRSKHLSSHAGLVAFPGGNADDSDIDEVATALREAKEEIGLPPEVVDIVAVLPQSPVRPSKIVTIVVGVIPTDFIPEINKKEVQKVFTLPLSRFLKGDHTLREMEYRTRPFNVYFFHDIIDSREIITWGFTASYCMQIALVALESDKEFIFRKNITITRHNTFDPIAAQEYLSRLSQVSTDAKL